MPAQGPDREAWGLLVLLALIWGSSFILMKRACTTRWHPGPPSAGGQRPHGDAWLALLPLAIAHLEASFPGTGRIGAGRALRERHSGHPLRRRPEPIDSALSGMLNGLTPLMTPW